MPIISVTLADISQSVFRPIIIDIVSQLMEHTKIDKTVPIFFGDDTGKMQSAGSGLDNKEDRLMRSDALRRLNVSANETYAEDQQITDITGKYGNLPVFTDPSLDAWIAPAYISSLVEIDLEFKTRSKEEARRWRDDVNARYLQGRQAIQHQITYSFNLPIPAWEVIHELYKKREAIAGYGDTFDEYMQKCFTNRVNIISNETGSQKQYTVSERMDRIQGYFGFTNDVPKAEFDEASGIYTVRFQYRFVYQCPSTVDIKYPVIVHQQLLDRPFIEFVNSKIVPDDRSIQRSQWLWGLEQLETNKLMKHLKPSKPYVRIPLQDDFTLNYTFPGTGTFMLALLQQQQGEKLAFNLRDLGDIEIDEDILNFIANGEYQYIGKPGKSMFHFDIYRGSQLCAYPAFHIDKDLNVWIDIDIDIRKEYRVRCALVTDLSMVDREALDRLMADPVTLMKVTGSINELLHYDSDFQKLGDQKKIYPWMMSRLYESIMGQGTCSIYSGPAVYSGAGGWGTNWTNNQRTFMTDIPENILRLYRSARLTRKDQQVFGVAVYRKPGS